MIEAETNDHNRQGQHVVLNRFLKSLMRKAALVQKVTIVDHCHGNLVQVQGLVNRTVDLLAMNVGRPVDSQIAPPVIPQGVTIVAPVNRALTVGQSQRHFAGAVSPTSVSKETAVVCQLTFPVGAGTVVRRSSCRWLGGQRSWTVG